MAALGAGTMPNRIGSAALAIMGIVVVASRKYAKIRALVMLVKMALEQLAMFTKSFRERKCLTLSPALFARAHEVIE